MNAPTGGGVSSCCIISLHFVLDHRVGTMADNNNNNNNDVDNADAFIWQEILDSLGNAETSDEARAAALVSLREGLLWMEATERQLRQELALRDQCLAVGGFAPPTGQVNADGDQEASALTNASGGTQSQSLGGFTASTAPSSDPEETGGPGTSDGSAGQGGVGA